jgi:ketosteroid isomerase-like protein
MKHTKRIALCLRHACDTDGAIALFDAEGTAREGRPYKNTYSWYMQMRDNRITNVVASLRYNRVHRFVERIQPQ